MEESRINIVTVGRVAYGEMLERQRTLFNERVALKKEGKDSGDDVIFFVEHDPVITLGKHAHKENVLFSEDALRHHDYESYELERRGNVT